MSAQAARKVTARKIKEHPFRPFRLPPKNFDLRGASDRELLTYGIPKPPSAETHLRLRLLWEELAERRPRLVEPKFEPFEGLRRSQLRDQRSIFDAAPYELRPYVTSWSRRLIDSGIWISSLSSVLPDITNNWCGAYVKRSLPLLTTVQGQPVGEPLRIVSGQWTVPSVSLPASAWNGRRWIDGTYLCMTWVGIDGTKGSNDVLQAGTGSSITVSGGNIMGTRYFIWTEWFGFPWIEQSLAVSPGDLISCIVCAPFENTHGTAMFANLSTNEAVNYGIDPPVGTSLSGNVAEWIAEDPTQSNGTLFPFPNFGQVQFTHCTAGTKTAELDLLGATMVDLWDGTGIRAQAFYQNRSALRCQFVR
jgi:hypothetical protein